MERLTILVSRQQIGGTDENIFSKSYKSADFCLSSGGFVGLWNPHFSLLDEAIVRPKDCLLHFRT